MLNEKPPGSFIDGRCDIKHLVGCGLGVLEGIFYRQELMYEMTHQPDEVSVVGVLEKLRPNSFARQIMSELGELFSCHSELAAHTTQARLIWQRLRCGQRVTVFCQILNPVAWTLFQMGQEERHNRLGRVISGDMKEEDFPHFACAGGRLITAPICVVDSRM